MSRPATMTEEQRASVAKEKRLLGTESDVRSMKGYERFHIGEDGTERKGEAPDGSYKWRVPFKPNNDGKLTKEAGYALELTQPAAQEGVRRSMGMQAARDRVRLRDKDGGIRTIDAAHADKTAALRGWSHVWRPGGLSVVGGVEGDMLWRNVAGKWYPTGKKTVGVLGDPCDTTVIQFDPDGIPWRWNGEDWIKDDPA